MNVVRSLSLIVIAAALSACAAKPVRDAAPVASTPITSASVVANEAAAEPVAVTNTVSAASSTPTTATPSVPASSNAEAPTNAEDDFAALYGGPDPSAAGSAQDDGNGSASYDPWEGFNRKVHSFNLAVDRTIARPLATGYVKVVPRFARTGVSNFFNNLRAPVTITNQLLQGRADDAWDSLGRFLMNSTLGIGGLFDPAGKAMVPRRNEDFGQTLGVWGWRPSRYLELPFFGPRTVRDVFGLAGDIPLSPIRTIEDDKIRIGLQGLQLVDTRAQLMSLDDIRNSAVDEYALTRDAWLQRRNYQIERDMRGGRHRDQEEQTTIPVDAMPMPDWGR
jgi:phospholipid-binding lipoprotein MlaA